MRTLLFLSVVTVGCTGPTLTHDAIVPARLSPAALDFGRTWIGTPRELALDLANPNKTSLEVPVSLAAGPFTVSVETVTVGPGDSASLLVRFDPSVDGAVTGTLDVAGQAVPLSGEGKTPPPCDSTATCTPRHFSPEQGVCVEAPAPDGTPCVAAASCFASAQCSAGVCVGVGSTCHDDNECTLDVCTATGCAAIDQSASCPAPSNPCLAAACDPHLGCSGVPVADGVPCGVTDCVRAPVCIAGACVIRPAPHTPACTNWEQEGYLKASNSGSGDAFGRAVSVSADGSTLAVGAWFEDSVDVAHPGDNSVFEAGAVYVFHRTGIVWAPEAFLKAATPGTGDRFGGALALSADGNTLVVGAEAEDSDARGVNGNQASNSSPGSGAAYVFVRQAGTWAQQAYLKASNTDPNDGFGTSVAASANGDVIAIGAPGEASSATGVGGAESDNSRARSGAVYVFSRTTAAWSQTAYVKATNTGASDGFGTSVALSSDGRILIAGAPGQDDGATDSGEAYVFHFLAGGGWAPEASLKGAGPVAGAKLGQAIGVSGDGHTFVAGAPSESVGSRAGAGAAHVFTFGASWSELTVLHASNADDGDGFGTAVAFSRDGSVIAVGAPNEDSNGSEADNSSPDSGAAYVFIPVNGVWAQVRYLKASNHEAFDLFGGAVSLSSDGSTLGIGATGESSAATQVDGDQTDNSATSAGAAYVF